MENIENHMVLDGPDAPWNDNGNDDGITVYDTIDYTLRKKECPITTYSYHTELNEEYDDDGCLRRGCDYFIDDDADLASDFSENNITPLELIKMLSNKLLDEYAEAVKNNESKKKLEYIQKYIDACKGWTELDVYVP